MKKIFLLSAAFFCLLAFSCKKENPSPQDKCLDRPRCEGCDWNVFRCKVNGEDWCANCESNDPLFGCDPVDCQFYPSDKTLEIYALGEYFLHLYNYKSIIEGDSSQFFLKKSVFGNITNNSDCIRYDLDTITISYLYTNKINSIEKVVEGSFEFDAINNCQDTVRITDGYFKLTYRP